MSTSSTARSVEPCRWRASTGIDVMGTRHFHTRFNCAA
jgi:hypothetical protein